MQVYDIIMIIILVTAMLFGAWKGLAWQVASMAAIFLSYFVAVRFRGELAAKIDAAPPWNTFLAMLILYMGTSLAVWLVFRLVAGFIDRLKLKEFDRQFGALLGIVKGVVLGVVVTLFAVTLLGEKNRAAIMKSRSGYYIALLLDRSHAIMPEEMHTVLEPYIHNLDEQLPPGERQFDRAQNEPESNGNPLFDAARDAAFEATRREFGSPPPY